MFMRFKEYVPAIGADVYVDERATVIGNVTLADGVTVLPGAVIRAEEYPIAIGAGTVIEDGCILHADEPGLVIGRDVVVGHGAILHGTVIGDGTLIGMGATLLAGSTVGAGCLVAAGSLVTQGKDIPDGSLAIGSPAKVVGEVSEEHATYIDRASTYYRQWGDAARRGGLTVCDPMGPEA